MSALSWFVQMLKIPVLKMMKVVVVDAFLDVII